MEWWITGEGLSPCCELSTVVQDAQESTRSLSLMTFESGWGNKPCLLGEWWSPYAVLCDNEFKRVTDPWNSKPRCSHHGLLGWSSMVEDGDCTVRHRLENQRANSLRITFLEVVWSGILTKWVHPTEGGNQIFVHGVVSKKKKKKNNHPSCFALSATGMVPAWHTGFWLLQMSLVTLSFYW